MVGGSNYNNNVKSKITNRVRSPGKENSGSSTSFNFSVPLSNNDSLIN
jgi:hypothetical protein